MFIHLTSNQTDIEIDKKKLEIFYFTILVCYKQESLRFEIFNSICPAVFEEQQENYELKGILKFNNLSQNCSNDETLKEIFSHHLPTICISI